MAASVNKVILIGTLGRKPELRRTTGGTAVTDFSIATNERFKAKDGTNQESTEWHNIVVWSRLAELVCQYLDKGRSIYVEGKLRTRTWEDNGQKHYRTEIVAQEVRFLDGGRTGMDNNSSTGGARNDEYSRPSYENNNNFDNGYNGSGFAESAKQGALPPEPIEDDLPF